MKKTNIFAIIVVIVFAVVLAMPWFLHAVIGDQTSGEESGGLTEKGDLAEFPTSFSDNFFEEIGAAFRDHSPLRNKIIQFHSDITQKYETFYRNRIAPFLTGIFIRDEAVNEPVEGDEETPEPTFDFGGLEDLFGTPTPVPTATPSASPAPTPEPSPTQEATATPTTSPEPTSEPSPAPETFFIYDSAAYPEFISYFDSLLLNGDRLNQPDGDACGWLKRSTIDGILDLTNANAQVIKMVGWVSFKDIPVVAFGYLVNDKIIILDTDFAGQPEQAVINHGGELAKRFYIEIDVRQFTGKNSFVAIAELLDGSIVKLNQPNSDTSVIIKMPETAAEASPDPSSTPSPTPTPTPSSTPGSTAKPSTSPTPTPGSTAKPSTSPTPTPTSAPTSCSHMFVVLRTQKADSEHYGYVLKKCNKCGEYKYEMTANKTTSTSTLVAQYGKDVIYGRYDWLFYTGSNSVAYYSGTNKLSLDEMESWRVTLESFQKKAEEKGIKVAVMTCPNKNVVYSEYFPTNIAKGDPTRALLFYNYMKANSTANYIYPLAEELAAKYYYDTYLKQDTHWNEYGAFIGTQAVYKSLGLPMTNINNVTITLNKKRGGDLSNFCGLSSEYEVPSIDYKPSISFDFVGYSDNSVNGNPVECGIITSTSPNPAKAVVIGDSFRNSMKPFLGKDFSKVSVFHRSELTAEGHESYRLVWDAIDDLVPGDVLIILAVERYDFNNISSAAMILDHWNK